MLSHKVFGAGIPGLATQAICQDGNTGISAAGTDQSGATELTAAVNVVGTVGAGSGVICYSGLVPVDSQLVFNGGANPLIIYPPSGFKINNLPANTGVILALNTAIELTCVTSTQIVAIMSA